MSYTKGPWKVSNGMTVKAGNKNICSHVNAAARHEVSMMEDIEIAKCNARLISAAPDQHEALLATQSLLERMGLESSDEYAQNAAAIAKALGE